MIRGTAAAAGDASAAIAAQSALDASGSAIDAIIAGFFAAAGAHADVLFGPTIALAAGIGVGARAFDGRSAQPGRGAPRPRGFVDAQRVPDAARIAVPRSLGMLALMHGYFGRTRLKELVKPGVSAAEQAGAPSRAGVLREIGSLGAIALRGREVERALLAAGGPVAGGVLTTEDLVEAIPAEADAFASEVGETTTALEPPWPIGALARPAEAIVACDAWGTVAALAYTRAGDGVVVPELDLVLGRDAVPVRRGIPRVAPGTLLPVAAPIALLQRSGFTAAIALPGRPSIEVQTLTALVRGAALEAGLEELRERSNADTAIAVFHDNRDARAARAGAAR